MYITKWEALIIGLFFIAVGANDIIYGSANSSLFYQAGGFIEVVGGAFILSRLYHSGNLA